MTAGYLVWKGRLSLPCALIVGILAAMIGDHLGYWNGRRFGQAAVTRGARWIRISPERFSRIQHLAVRSGPVGVFLERFVPGIRFLAGPLAEARACPPCGFFWQYPSGPLLRAARSGGGIHPGGRAGRGC